MAGLARTPPLITASDGAKQIGLTRRECTSIIGALKKKRLPYLDRWRAIRDYELPFTGELDETPDENEQALTTAYEFVQETRIVEELKVDSLEKSES